LKKPASAISRTVSAGTMPLFSASKARSASRGAMALARSTSAMASGVMYSLKIWVERRNSGMGAFIVIVLCGG